jgi:hypothetical protein
VTLPCAVAEVDGITVFLAVEDELGWQLSASFSAAQVEVVWLHFLCSQISEVISGKTGLTTIAFPNKGGLAFLLKAGVTLQSILKILRSWQFSDSRDIKTAACFSVPACAGIYFNTGTFEALSVQVTLRSIRTWLKQLVVCFFVLFQQDCGGNSTGDLELKILLTLRDPNYLPTKPSSVRLLPGELLEEWLSFSDSLICAHNFHFKVNEQCFTLWLIRSCYHDWRCRLRVERGPGRFQALGVIPGIANKQINKQNPEKK